MMKKVKKMLVLVFTLMFMMLNSTMAFATETTVTPTTGTQVENCNLIFRVGYLGNEFKDDLTVNLKDIGSNRTYQFVLKASSGYGGSENFSIMANTTYEINVTFPNSKFEVKNADGTEIKKIHATATGLELYWQIQPKKDTTVKTTTQETTTQETTTQETNKEQLTSEELLKDFNEKVGFIKDDSSYKDFIENWACVTYKDKFLEIKGNTEAKWNAMSKYEQACYSILFTYPRMLVLGTNSNIYAKDRETFLKNLDVAKKPLLKNNNGEVVYNALVKVWDWHWTNWSKTRTFVNPYEGTTYDISDREQSENDFELSAADKNDLDTGNVTKELSSKENFFSIVKNHILSILIFIGAGIALGVVIYKNRKKNLDDNISDKK